MPLGGSEARYECECQRRVTPVDVSFLRQSERDIAFRQVRARGLRHANASRVTTA